MTSSVPRSGDRVCSSRWCVKDAISTACCLGPGPLEEGDANMELHFDRPAMYRIRVPFVIVMSSEFEYSRMLRGRM